MSKTPESPLCVNQCVVDIRLQMHTPAVTKKAINYKIVVGKNVKQLRLEAVLTQEHLADRCGIFRTYLSRIEAGIANPTLIVLVALADSLGVTPKDLLNLPSTTSKPPHRE